MYNTSALLKRALLPVLALLLLTSCAPVGSNAWENVHQGLIYDNIYTGDDHI